MERSAPLEPSHISETTRTRMLEFYTHLNGDKYSISSMNIFQLGGCGRGRSAPSIILGLPHISETTRA